MHSVGPSSELTMCTSSTFDDTVHAAGHHLLQVKSAMTVLATSAPAFGKDMICGRTKYHDTDLLGEQSTSIW